jgi:hypothetical protein
VVSGKHAPFSLPLDNAGKSFCSPFASSVRQSLIPRKLLYEFFARPSATCTVGGGGGQGLGFRV